MDQEEFAYERMYSLHRGYTTKRKTITLEVSTQYKIIELKYK